jgi:hypothetical protein
MPRVILIFIAFFASLALASCTGNRVDIVDTTLDRTLYPADTKAERLLRYFEVQALLVRFAAETGAGAADRNAMALANVAATAQLNVLTECLQVGSINMSQNDVAVAHPVPYVNKYWTDPNFLSLSVRTSSAYCSFFESRLLSYQDALFSMLRQAAHDDATAQLLNDTLTGVNVLNFANFVSTLVRAASSVYRDERVLRAFTADALELEYLVWESSVTSPDQIYSICPGGAQCDDTTLVYPERAKTNLDDLRRNAGGGSSTNRPQILVWHFQEVYAFMISACRSLNGDNPAVANVQQTQCSANVMFPFPLALHQAPPKPVTPVAAPPQSVIPAQTVPKCGPTPALNIPVGPLTDDEFTANCKKIASDLEDEQTKHNDPRAHCDLEAKIKEINALLKRNGKVCPKTS